MYANGASAGVGAAGGAVEAGTFNSNLTRSTPSSIFGSDGGAGGGIGVGADADAASVGAGVDATGGVGMNGNEHSHVRLFSFSSLEGDVELRWTCPSSPHTPCAQCVECG